MRGLLSRLQDAVPVVAVLQALGSGFGFPAEGKRVGYFEGDLPVGGGVVFVVSVIFSELPVFVTFVVPSQKFVGADGKQPLLVAVAEHQPVRDLGKLHVFAEEQFELVSDLEDKLPVLVIPGQAARIAPRGQAVGVMVAPADVVEEHGDELQGEVILPQADRCACHEGEVLHGFLVAGGLDEFAFLAEHFVHGRLEMVAVAPDDLKVELFPVGLVIDLHVPDCPRLEAGIPATPQPRVVLLQGAVGLVQGGGVLVEPAMQADGRVVVEGVMKVKQELVVPIPPR